MEQISFKNTRMGGFWHQKQQQVKDITIPNVYKRFYETGRFDAFKCEWKEGDDKKPHIFWDSDVAKWMESVAYIIDEYPDKELEKKVDETVALIKKNQGEDGYFNIYFTVCEPDNRFTNRMAHELYCAGHLTEAAVAYYEATGKDEFLKCMEKYIAYIKKVFVDEDSADFSTPGHEEIELALIKLWKCTGNDEYLKLARHFINTRGTSQKDIDSPYYISHAYDQTHIPVREMDSAVGHSVRAAYLYCGMADLAAADKDGALMDACRKLFFDIANKKMYVTGGIGSALIGEAFSEDYDLPNELAYSETCAAIALALFARRMSLNEIDSRYDDIAELALYNGALAGNSVDGKSFFYEDPLEINLKERDMTLQHRCSKQHMPITQRVEVFDCSCCPPNFTRLVASIADFLYSTNGDTVFVHHYAESKSEFDGIGISQSTSYPNNGKVLFNLSGATGKTLALRIPGWCDSPAFTVNGKTVKPDTDKGFAYIKIESENTEVVADFKMEACLLEANPLVENNFGRVALKYGPIVYCLEGVDNSTPLRSLAVNKTLNADVKYDDFFKMNTIEADGFMYERFDGLYRPFKAKKEAIRLKFIPYYGFANRGESDMLVWVRVDE